MSKKPDYTYSRHTAKNGQVFIDLTPKSRKANDLWVAYLFRYEFTESAFKAWVGDADARGLVGEEIIVSKRFRVETPTGKAIEVDRTGPKAVRVL